MMIRILSLLVLFVLAEGAHQLPSYIEPCHRDDPDINDCIQKNAQKLKPMLPDGIKELLIPKIAPLFIPQADLVPDSSLSVNLKNAYIHYIDKCDFVKLHFDLKQLQWYFELFCKEINLISDYKIKGKVLILVLDTTGHATGNFSDNSIKFNVQLEKKQKRGKEFLSIKSTDMKLSIRKYQFHLDRLFGDNKELNEAAQKILNENYEPILEEFTPIFKQIIEDLLIRVHSRLLARFPYDVLFPKTKQ